MTAGPSCGNGASSDTTGASTGTAATGAQPTPETKPTGTAGASGSSTAGTRAADGGSVASAAAGTTAASAGSAAGSGNTGAAAGSGAAAGATAEAAGAGGSPGGPASVPTHPGVPPEVSAAWAEWPLPGKDYNNSRYTTSSTLNSSNVSTLKEAWKVELPGLVIAYGMISTVPLIAGGTVYIEDTFCSVRAIDLATGKVKWTAEGSDLNPGPNGVAVGWGKVFAIGGSDSVIAYDAESGKQLWAKKVTDTPTDGIDIQPTVFDGKVFVSTVPISTRGIYVGGDRGILKALDQETGAEVWRFDTIESPADVWGNTSVNSGGGSWFPPSFDLDSGRVFWAVANPAPFPGTPEFPNGSSREGLNLYTDSTVALDVKTGAYQWHHQTVSHDLFDRDLLHTMLTDIGGVPAVISTGKEGRVWATRRDNGEVLWGPTPIGMHKNDELLELTGATEVYPGSFGGVLTPPALADGVIYVAELNAPTMYSANATAYFGSEIGTMNGDLAAIDAATGEIIWNTSVDGDPTGGVTVVNDLVLTATFQGNVIAYARDTGKEVWRWTAPGGINSWMSVSGDMVVVPVGASSPATIFGLRVGGGTTTPPAAGSGGTAGRGGAAGSSGGAAGGEAAGAVNTFSAIHRDILAPRCAGPVCHSSSMTGGGLNVGAGNASAVRTALVNMPATGSECASSGMNMVVPGQPEMSLLYRKLIDMPPCGTRMPPTGALNAAELDRIRTWIANGALNN
jgi:outer membrane protein assembly factor BamB